MNIESIGEPIRVLADFSGGQVQPVRFRWGKRTYRVDRLNGRWTDRGEDGCSLCFSVQSGDETYYLRFDMLEVRWMLEKVVTE